ncbi:hypothetical protein QVD17_33335 [Tagetes erecta]|uniref:Uncharacterized protein n=1 Tax=Tagetes erecta TaxID=13708 RepID=A0AAD8NL21_TARER|nr:hypothetical protein QVD17_33335 [Tagetes erecta]
MRLIKTNIPNSSGGMVELSHGSNSIPFKKNPILIHLLLHNTNSLPSSKPKISSSFVNRSTSNQQHQSPIQLL